MRGLFLVLTKTDVAGLDLSGHDQGRKVVVAMTATEGRPYWFGMSLPRQNRWMLDHWWWCAVALLLIVYRNHGGLISVVWCLRHCVNPAYVYAGRHYLHSTDDIPIPAVALIIELRQERKEHRNGMAVVFSSGGESGLYGRYVTPLLDRTPGYFDWKEDDDVNSGLASRVRCLSDVPTGCDDAQVLPGLCRSDCKAIGQNTASGAQRAIHASAR